MRCPPTPDSHGVRKPPTCRVGRAVVNDRSLSDQTTALSRHLRAGLGSPYNGSGIAEARTRTIDHAAPRPETVQQSWKHFPHQADIDARGIGSTKAATYESAAHALTAVITYPESVASTYLVLIVCKAPDDEWLLVDWLNAFVHEMATRKLWFFWSDRICVFSYGLMMDGNITASECVWAAARVQVPTQCHPPSPCGFSP